MITYLIIGKDKIETEDAGFVFEEGMKIYIEENGIRQSYKIESIITVFRKTNNICDPPVTEVILNNG